MMNYFYCLLSYYTTFDTIPPQVLNCSQDINKSIELGLTRKQVFWTEPHASDLSGNVSLVSQSHTSGDFYEFVKTEITYTLSDETGNLAVCKFQILLTPGKFLNRQFCFESNTHYSF